MQPSLLQPRMRLSNGPEAPATGVLAHVKLQNRTLSTLLYTCRVTLRSTYVINLAIASGKFCSALLSQCLASRVLLRSCPQPLLTLPVRISHTLVELSASARIRTLLCLLGCTCPWAPLPNEHGRPAASTAIMTSSSCKTRHCDALPRTLVAGWEAALAPQLLQRVASSLRSCKARHRQQASSDSARRSAAALPPEHMPTRAGG